MKPTSSRSTRPANRCASRASSSCATGRPRPRSPSSVASRSRSTAATPSGSRCGTAAPSARCRASPTSAGELTGQREMEGLARHHQGVTAVGLDLGVPADLRHRPRAAGLQGDRVLPERPRRERAGQRRARAGGAGARVVVDRRHLPRAAQAAVRRRRDSGARRRCRRARRRAGRQFDVSRSIPMDLEDPRAAEAAAGQGELRSAQAGAAADAAARRAGDVAPASSPTSSARASRAQEQTSRCRRRASRARRRAARRRTETASAVRSIRSSCPQPYPRHDDAALARARSKMPWLLSLTGIVLAGGLGALYYFHLPPFSPPPQAGASDAVG